MQHSGGASSPAIAAATPDSGARELLRIGGGGDPALLSVLCGGAADAAAAFIAVGDFVLATVTKPDTGLALIEYSVQDHRWLLATDSAVIRVGRRKFSFSFPGFFYALSLPHGSFDHEIEALELVLRDFRYHDHSASRDSEFYPRRRGFNFWAAAYAEIAALSAALVPPAAPIAADLSAAVRTAKKSSIAARIALLVLKHMRRPAPYVAIAGSFSGSVFPSICVVFDVMEAIDDTALFRPKEGEGVQLSPAARRAHLAGLNTACWSFNAMGLVIVFYAVAASRAAAMREARSAAAQPASNVTSL